MRKINVTIWNEAYHEFEGTRIHAIYPNGIHGCLEEFFNGGHPEIGTVRVRTMYDEEQGFKQEDLDDTDVLLYWAHISHDNIKDEYVQRIYDRVVNGGMGLIVLHSAHESKIFAKLCGTNTGCLRWREGDDKERIWVMEPQHPICNNLPDYIELPGEETYGERFEIPKPDSLVFVSWFSGGELFRSGVTYSRGRGKVFYFRPGHEGYPTYYNPQIRQILLNAVLWAAPMNPPKVITGWTPPLEKKASAE